MTIELSLKEVDLIGDALVGYAHWLERALSETHVDLKTPARLKRHQQRVDCIAFRGELYRRFNAARQRGAR